MCKVGIWPALKILLTFRSSSDSKNVKFHSMTAKYGYKNLYEIISITQCQLSMSFNDTNGGRWAYSRHSRIRSQNYHCLQCLSNLDTSFVITWKLCDFFWFDKSIKKRSEKVTTNFHWLLRILKLSKLYIKDAKEYIRSIGGA